ncbi:MAG: HlyC/CorC family transporter [Acidimicrobiia bacterium]|nr:HlyC/CorC family transporter [Acidimicrobiia bacterium]
MITPHNLTLLIIFAICLMLSGFLSGSETALTAIARERVEQLAATGRRGRRLGLLTGDLEGTIGTILLANNFVNILATTVAAALVFDLVGETWGTILSTVLVTIMVLIIGEVTPKTLAARYPEWYAMTVAVPVWGISIALRPIARVFVRLGQSIIGLFRSPARAEPGITQEDVRALTVLGERDGEIKPGVREIIDRLFMAADQPVRDVMTPRMDILTLTWPVSSSDVREAVATSAHSRFPVVKNEGDLDSIVGVLYAKDVFSATAEMSDHEVARLVKTPYYAPESASVIQVLEHLRTHRIGLAIVTDEHGGVDGLVTVKDLVGELVGELQDETDSPIPAVEAVGSRVWKADGRTPIDELEEIIGVSIEDGPYSTVAGLFLSLFGQIPTAGDQVDHVGIRLTVEQMDRHRIATLSVEQTDLPALTS